MSDWKNVLRVILLYRHLITLRKRRKKINLRRYWVKPFLRLRRYLGAYRTIFLSYENEDHEEFRNLTRMTVREFDTLHDLVKRKLVKTSYRESIPTEMRLASVIVMLAHGHSIRVNAMLFRFGRSTMQQILSEVCKAIVEVLIPIYMPTLDEDTWKRVSEEFEHKWNMPHCLGALDGKHFELQKPPHSGSLFFCYKKFFSMVLLAMCDAHKRFMWFNVGHYGSFNDASIFMTSDLYAGIYEGTLNIPEPTPLKGSDISMPFFFVPDSIFGLHQNVMKPFAQSEHSSKEQEHYNYRVSRARITIECAFGILTARWRIFERPLAFNLATVEAIIVATILLHNFLITQQLIRGAVAEINNYEDGFCLNDPINLVDEGDNRIFANSERQRRKLMEYFQTLAGLFARPKK